MQIISQEVCTCVSTVTIKNGKKRALWPSVTFFLLRLLNVEHNTNSIFIIISNDPLVSIGCISFNHSVLFDRVLGALEVGQLYMRDLHR
jgi:hypothetical protein